MAGNGHHPLRRHRRHLDPAGAHVPVHSHAARAAPAREEPEEELEDNVIDDDEIEFQGTNEPEIINDIPVNYL